MQSADRGCPSNQPEDDFFTPERITNNSEVQEQSNFVEPNEILFLEGGSGSPQSNQHDRNNSNFNQAHQGSFYFQPPASEVQDRPGSRAPVIRPSQSPPDFVPEINAFEEQKLEERKETKFDLHSVEIPAGRGTDPSRRHQVGPKTGAYAWGSPFDNLDSVGTQSVETLTAYKEEQSSVEGAVASTGPHFEVINSNPLIFAFGQNSYGELGIGDTGERLVPTHVPAFDKLQVKNICAGNEHIAVVTRQGEVYTVGFNGSGQLGHGNQKSLSLPQKVKKFHKQEGRRTVSVTNETISFISSANGCESISYISESGLLYTCGYNNYGQLGNGTQVNMSDPTMILGNIRDSMKIISVSSSYYHTIIVGQDKNNPNFHLVYTVGRNDNGQLGQGHFCHELTPRINRTLSTPQIKVVQTSCGLHHTVFITSNNQLFSCGFNDNGQLGHCDTRSRNIPELVVSEGLDQNSVKYASCGYYHTIVLKLSGEVYAFGRNDKGQLGIRVNGVALLEPRKIETYLVIVQDSEIDRIVQSASHSRALSFASSADLQSSRELPRFQASRSNGFYDPGSFHQYRGHKYFAKQNMKITKVACGCYHSLLVSEEGHLLTFGRGNHGQLGHGNIEDQQMPRQVPNLTDRPIQIEQGTDSSKQKRMMHLKVVQVAGGFYHSVILMRQRHGESVPLNPQSVADYKAYAFQYNMGAYLEKHSNEPFDAQKVEEPSCLERKAKILVRSDSSLDEQIKADLKFFKDQESLLETQDSFMASRQKKLMAIHETKVSKDPPPLFPAGRSHLPDLRNHQVRDLLLVDQDAGGNNNEEVPSRNNNDSLERLDLAAQTQGSNQAQEEPANLTQYLPCLEQDQSYQTNSNLAGFGIRRDFYKQLLSNQLDPQYEAQLQDYSILVYKLQEGKKRAKAAKKPPKAFKCCSAILQLRSPKMFEAFQDAKLQLQLFHSKSLELTLRYLHTGSFPKLRAICGSLEEDSANFKKVEELVLDLLALGSRFCIPFLLKKVCELIMSEPEPEAPDLTGQIGEGLSTLRLNYHPSGERGNSMDEVQRAGLFGSGQFELDPILSTDRQNTGVGEGIRRLSTRRQQTWISSIDQQLTPQMELSASTAGQKILKEKFAQTLLRVPNICRFLKQLFHCSKVFEDLHVRQLPFSSSCTLVKGPNAQGPEVAESEGDSSYLPTEEDQPEVSEELSEMSKMLSAMLEEATSFTMVFYQEVLSRDEYYTLPMEVIKAINLRVVKKGITIGS